MIATLQEHYCSTRGISDVANAYRMVGGLKGDSALIQELSAWAGKPPSTIAREAGLAATTLSRPYAGTATTRISQPTLDRLRQKYPDFPGWRSPSNSRVEATGVQQAQHPHDREAVPITSLDLSLSMGPGTLIEEFVESEPVMLDLALLQSITRTPTDRLRLVRGIGHSMEPTLRSNDRILIDINDRAMAMLGGVYWIDFQGAHGIKRLRPAGKGRILIMSDNTVEPSFEVDASELRIEGRAIWFAREL